MEYRNYLRKYNSGKLQNVFLHIKKNIYEKHKQGHVKVKNIFDNGKKRKIKITTEPVKVAQMRNRNYLFRAFSFILFG